MNFLIKVLAALIARRIEAGSKLGALLGTVAGIALGLVLWLLIHNAAELAAIYALVFAIPLALIGAILGSFLPPSRSDAAAYDSANICPHERIRLTDFNHTLIPPIMLSIFGTGTVGSVYAILSGQEGGWKAVGIFLLVCALAVLSAFITIRTIFWVDIASTVTVQCLFRHKVYQSSQIHLWTIAPDDDALALSIRFDDHYQLDFPVAPSKIQPLTARLTELAPDRLASSK